MIDKIRASTVERQTRRIDADLNKIIEDLRHGNIHEVLAKAKVPKGEIQKFFSNQWRQWQSQIVQNYETYASPGVIPEPQKSDFSESNPQNAFGGGDGAVLLEGILGTSKAAVVQAGKAEGTDAEPLSLGEVEGMAEGTLDEWDGFMGELWSQVLDAQMLRIMKRA